MVVTTDADAPIEPIHNRMPVILVPEVWNAWLDPATAMSELMPLLRPAPAEGMQAWPVSRDVGNASNDGPQLIEAT